MLRMRDKDVQFQTQVCCRALGSGRAADDPLSVLFRLRSLFLYTRCYLFFYSPLCSSSLARTLALARSHARVHAFTSLPPCSRVCLSYVYVCVRARVRTCARTCLRACMRAVMFVRHLRTLCVVCVSLCVFARCVCTAGNHVPMSPPGHQPSRMLSNFAEGNPSCTAGSLVRMRLQNYKIQYSTEKKKDNLRCAFKI